MSASNQPDPFIRVTQTENNTGLSFTSTPPLTTGMHRIGHSDVADGTQVDYSVHRTGPTESLVNPNSMHRTGPTESLVSQNSMHRTGPTESQTRTVDLEQNHIIHSQVPGQSIPVGSALGTAGTGGLSGPVVGSSQLGYGQNYVPFQSVSTPQAQGVNVAQLAAMQSMFMQSLGQFGLLPQGTAPVQTTRPVASDIDRSNESSYSNTQSTSHTYDDQMDIDQEYLSDTDPHHPQVGGSERVWDSAKVNAYRKAVELTFETLTDELAYSDAESDDSYTSIGETKSKDTRPRELFFPMSNRAGYDLSKTFKQVKRGIDVRVSRASKNSVATPVGIFPGPPCVPNREYSFKTYHIHASNWQHADRIRGPEAGTKSGKDRNKQPITGLEPPSPQVPDQAVLKWEKPANTMELNPSATVRMDRAIRSHMGLANSFKFMQKATHKHIAEAKSMLDEVMLEYDTNKIAEKMRDISERVEHALTLSEQLKRLANDNMSLASDQMVLWTLLQRDKWLVQLPKEVSFETQAELRTSDFGDGKLFPPELLAKAAEEIRSRRKETVDEAAHKRDAAYLLSDAPRAKKQKANPPYQNPYYKGGRGKPKVKGNSPKSVPAAAAGSAAQTATDGFRPNSEARGQPNNRGYRGRGSRGSYRGRGARGQRR